MHDGSLWSIVLGAALHDLGKVFLRAGDAAAEAKARQHCVARSPHGSFSSCPDCRRDFRYLHAFLGWALARELLPAVWAEKAASLAGAHHRPMSGEAKVVALADRLSAAEREAQDDERRTDHLRSLLPELELGQPKGKARYFPLRPLVRQVGQLYPTEREQLAAGGGSYAALWQSLEETLRQLKQSRSWAPSEEEAYSDSLLTCLQVYLWSVPAATYHDIGDISLYEHLRLTAALAAAIARQRPSEDALDAALSGEDGADGSIAFDLVMGDISGVQDFLYTLTSRAVARGLRGRSFYLDLVSELVARWLLRRFGLPSCNLVYCGGARFYLLAQPLGEEQFVEAKKELARKFLGRFQGKLYVALAKHRLPLSAVREGGWTEVVGKLEKGISEAKGRRFSELGPTEMARQLFLPAGGGPPEKVCAICGREGADLPLDEDGERKQCRTCRDLADLGRDIADASALASYPATGGEGDSPDALWPFLGYRVEPMSGPESRALRRAPLWLWVDLDEDAVRGALASLGRWERPPSLLARFLRPVTPRVEPGGAIADFEALAKAAVGDALLGVLKMDVDNLGQVFSRGLGQRGSPSRWSTLSFLMRLFFEGRVAELATEVEQGQGPERPLRALVGDLTGAAGAARHLYVIYSGGDDLLVVGSWDLVVELALLIREEFRRFSGNPRLTASAGVHLADYGLPLYQLVRDAHEALEQAKARRDHKGEVVKDGVTFLGETLGWEELRQVKRQAQRLLRLLDRGGAPRSLMHRLMALYGQEQSDRERLRRRDGRPHYGRWLWLAVYFLSRLAEQHQGAGADLRAIAQEVDKDPTVLWRYAYASRWAELLTRERIKEVGRR